MASAARGFVLSSRVSDLSLKRLHPPQLPPPPLPPACRHHVARRGRPSSAVTCCLSGGVSDDFVSTRKSSLDRGFSVIANMLKRIDPLDNSVISKGVSDVARDSMKQTISAMLGLLPSDQFSVAVEVSDLPLRRLLFSSIITGYTLWNAEYRLSLVRNLDISPSNMESLSCPKRQLVCESEGWNGEQRDVQDDEFRGEVCTEDFERSPPVFGDLPPEALNYIQRLQAEIHTAEEELNVQKQKNMKLEFERENRNELLEYLRSLDSDMVTELSRPSSLEVEDIIQQLVQNVLKLFFKEDPSSHFMGDSVMKTTGDYYQADGEVCGTLRTSRDYLAKLLFWCMLLGHHLRGLENRLHLSCVVGLL